MINKWYEVWVWSWLWFGRKFHCKPEIKICSFEERHANLPVGVMLNMFDVVIKDNAVHFNKAETALLLVLEKFAQNAGLQITLSGLDIFSIQLSKEASALAALGEFFDYSLSPPLPARI